MSPALTTTSRQQSMTSGAVSAHCPSTAKASASRLAGRCSIVRQQHRAPLHAKFTTLLFHYSYPTILRSEARGSERVRSSRREGSVK